LISRLLQAFKRHPQAPRASTDGRTIYAVGDIHGRLDILDPLLEQIRADVAADPPQDKPVLVFVGDYVDRGAFSKGVIDRVIALKADDEFEVRALKGNHEEAILSFLDDPNFGPTWSEHGGAQTLTSYGVTAPILRMATQDWAKARDDLGETFPKAHYDFLRRLELVAVYGDYLFVHAGLRPGVPLQDQEEHDLLWIRNDFLTAQRPFEKIVVHGHTPEEEAYLGEIRIGIDTGAYATGLLTAVRLREADRKLIQARAKRPA